MCLLAGCSCQPKRDQPQSPRDSARHLEAGIRSYARHSLPSAIGEFRQAYASDSTSFRAVDLLASAWTEAGKSSEALAYFDALASRRPRDPLPLYGSGSVLLAMGRDSLALERLVRAIELDPNQAALYEPLVEAAKRVGRVHEVSEFAMRLDVPRPTSGRVAGLVALLTAQFKVEEALALVDEAIRLDPSDPLPHLHKATLMQRAGATPDALREAQVAESLASAPGRGEHLARALYGRGNAYQALGRLPEALSVYREALQTAVARGQRRVQLKILSGVGFLQILSGEHASARDTLERTVSLARALGDVREEAYALRFLGDLAGEEGRYRHARPLHEEALVKMRLARDRSGESGCLNSLANTYSYLNDFRRGIDLYEEARTLDNELGDDYGASVATLNMGYNYQELGDLSTALAHFVDARRALKELGREYEVAQCAGALGTCYFLLGDFGTARLYLQESLDACRSVGAKPFEAKQIGSLAAVDYEEGKLDDADRRMREALRLFQSIPSQRDVGISFGNLATLRIAKKDYSAAKAYADSSLHIARDISNSHGEGETLCTLGEALLEMGDVEGAEKAYRRALGIGDSLQAPKTQWIAKDGLGQCMLRKGSSSQARELLRSAVETVEEASRKLPVEEHRYGFMSSKLDLYEHLIHVLSDLDQREPSRAWAGEALEVAERAKARAFVDMLKSSRISMKTKVETEIQAAEAELVHRISRLCLASWQGGESAGEARAELDRAERELVELRNKARRTAPRFAELLDPAPMRVGKILQSLKDNGCDALIEYFLGAKESYLWVVKPDGVKLHRLPRRERIEGLVDAYLAAIRRPPSLDAEREDGAELSNVLLGPLFDGSFRGRRLIVVADGGLLRLPFETLPFPGRSGTRRLLVEEVRMTYLPSSSCLSLLNAQGTRRRATPHSILAIAYGGSRGSPAAWPVRQTPGGDTPAAAPLPPLLFTEDEVNRVCGLFPAGACKVMSGDQAQERALSSMALNRFDVLHLATHALVDDAAPKRSCIVLAPPKSAADDGALVMDEIFNLQSAPDLVVLSSCESGIGKIVRGEGMVGLARGFFYAGSRSLLVSLWPVNDRSTSSLMVEFYRQLQAGLERDEAVRLAKLALLRGDTPTLRHPYYWAPFVLVGSGR